MKPYLTCFTYLLRLRRYARSQGVLSQGVQPRSLGSPGISFEDEGLTLIEALMAIVVLTIVLGSIAIPVAITVGSRVQNRKVEQAQQIAQYFTEQTRLQMSLLSTWTYAGTTPSISSATPTLSYSPVGAIPPLPTVSYSTVASVPAPTTNCNVTGPSYSVTCPSTAIFGYDLDEDALGAPDFYVQTFRVSDVRSPSNEVIGFDMGVRVYPLESLARLGSLSTIPLSVGFSSGVGDPTKPIATAYTSIYRSEESEALVGFNSCEVIDTLGLTSVAAINKITTSPTDKTTKFSYSLISDGLAPFTVSAQDPPQGTIALCGSQIKITY